MPNKIFALDDELAIKIYKRKSSRNLRLSVTSDGEVRVSIPAWAPYRVGVEFARSRQAWIRAQARSPQLLADDQAIGKAHHLSFVAVTGTQKTNSRLSGGTIRIRYPVGADPQSAAVQQVANAAGVRALRLQAEQLLPQRLAVLAAQHDFDYADVSIKRLKGRWGSCDNNRQIVLNLFLMQLPWELIDYVLLHELTHTRILRHGTDFWQAMDEVLADSKQLRRKLRAHQPVLTSLA